MSIIIGDSKNNLLNGTASDDIITGNGGNDTLNGGAGSDLLSGGAGDDILNGGSGDDVVLGGDGKDLFIHNISENIDVNNCTYDFYDGGSGIDTLRFIATREQAAGLTAALAAFNVFNKNYVFDFQQYVPSLDLKVIHIEKIEIVITNQAPTAVNDAATISEDGPPVLINVLANDTDPDVGDTKTLLSVSPTAQGAFVSIVSNQVKYDPGTLFNSLKVGETLIDTFTYTMRDSVGAISTATVTMTIKGQNDAPLAANDGIVAITNQNSSVTILASTLLANDTDPDHDAHLSIASVSGNSHISLNAAGDVFFTPANAGGDFTSLAQGESAIVSFSYVAKDEFGALSNSATAQLKVTGLNDTPTAVNDGIVGETDQNTNTTILASNLLGNDFDPDHGAVLSIASVSGDPRISLNATGDIAFNHSPDASSSFAYLAEGESAIVTFSYVAKDEFGALSNPASAEIKVHGLNDTPTAVNDGIVGETDQNTNTTILASSLLGNDFDPDHGAVLSIASVSGDPRISLNATGDIAFNHSPDASSSFAYLAQGESAIVSFSYVAKDEFGALSNSATAQLKVTGLNDTPTAVDDGSVAETDQNTNTVIFASSLLGNDFDPDHGAVLSIASVSGDPRVSLNATGDVSFNQSPDASSSFAYLAEGESAFVTFSYVAKDEFGALSNPALAQLKVTGLNDAPTAVDDDIVAITDQNSNVTILASTLLANDIDPDHGAHLSIASVGGDPRFSLSATGDIGFSHSPDASSSFAYLAQGESAIVTFTYVAKDEFGALSNPATAQLEVTGLNDAPVAVDDGIVAETDQNTNTTIFASSLLGNDFDPDHGAHLSIASVSGDPRFSLSATGDISFNHSPDASSSFAYLAEGESAFVTFSYVAKDEFGALSNAVAAQLEVTGLNDTPTANLDLIEVQEDVILTATGNMLQNDTDPDSSDSLVITNFDGMAVPLTGLIFNFDYGVLNLNPDGSYTFELNNTFPLTQGIGEGLTLLHNFDYTISDGHGGIANSTLRIAIAGTEDAPRANMDTASLKEDVILTTTGNILDNDQDPDFTDTLTVIAFDGQPIPTEGIDFSFNYGMLHLNPNGNYTVEINNAASQSLGEGTTSTSLHTYAISDGHGGVSSSIFTISIAGTNDAPTANLDLIEVQEDVILTATGNMLQNDTDPDSGDSLMITNFEGMMVPLTGLIFNFDYGVLNLNPNGSYTFELNNTSPLTQGIGEGLTLLHNFDYTISDDHGGIASSTLRIAIAGTEDAPRANMDTASLKEDVILTTTGNILDNDQDPDFTDTLTVTTFDGQSVPTEGIDFGFDYGTLHLNPNGNYTVEINNAASQSLGEGTTSTSLHTYIINDGHGGVSSSVFTISIAGTNDAPTAVNDTFTISEDNTSPTFIPVLANDTDPDIGDTKTIVSFSSPQFSTTSAGGNLIAFRLAPIYNSLAQNEVANESFTYTMRDSLGAVSTAVVNVVIQGQNDAPVAVNDGIVLTTNQNTPMTFSASALLGNDIDPDHNAQLSLLSVSTTTSGVQFSLNATGDVLFDPGTAFISLSEGSSVTLPFQYFMTDEFGAHSTAVAFVKINGLNDAPTAVNDTFTISEDNTLPTFIPVLANDTDPDIGDTKTIVSFSSPQFSTTSAGGNLIAFNLAPIYNSLAQNEVANESFTYTIRDSVGAVSTAVVNVIIQGQNDAPTAVNDGIVLTTNQNTPATFSASALLGNDIDPDHNAQLSLLSVSTTTSGAQFSLSATGDVLFDPGTAFISLSEGSSVTLPFQYFMTDEFDSHSTAVGFVTITGLNDLPIVSADTADVKEDTFFTATGNVLNNDSDIDTNDKLIITDVNGSPSGVGVSLNGNFGTLTLNSDGEYVYTLNNSLGTVQSLNEGEQVQDSFTYGISDGHGGTASSTLTVLIHGTDEPTPPPPPPPPPPSDGTGGDASGGGTTTGDASGGGTTGDASGGGTTTGDASGGGTTTGDASGGGTTTGDPSGGTTTGDSGGVLTLGINDVLSMADANNMVFVNSGPANTVDLDTGWSHTIGDTTVMNNITYDVYHYDTDPVILNIEQGMAVI